MAGPAGIKDVALRAGVSVGTVSNVLNRPHLVRAETRQRVEAAMADLAFVRNESARQLRAGSSRMLAYVFIDAENPFFIDVARGAEDACRERGFALIMCNSGEDPAREDDYLSLLLEQRVHGVLVTPSDDRGTRLRSLPALGVPVVLVDRGETDPTLWCSVGVDDVHGGELAVRHLLDVGHRRIAFVGGPLDVRPFADRLEGARRAVSAARPGSDRAPATLSVLSCEATSINAGHAAARSLATTDADERPTAVFCANDLVALGLLSELSATGLRVPDDVALVGYDDISFAAAAAVPLTSVRQPSRLIGRTAAELLLAEAEAGEDHVHEHVAFCPELVVRESSGSRPARTAIPGAETIRSTRVQGPDESSCR
jgi:LacI family transcriptional regulator